MPKYRKKAVEIEAVQWDGSAEEATPIIDWALSHDVSIRYYCPENCANDTHVLRVQTLEGTMTAKPGDYIVKGIINEFYPCKPDVFLETYEPVDSV